MGKYIDLDVSFAKQLDSLEAVTNSADEGIAEETLRNRTLTERRRMIEDRIEWRRINSELGFGSDDLYG
ncbi:MAG: hypothetical protein ACJAYG_002095 [Oceanicoccus sp.]|jgi:hypothetical protein